MALLTKTFDEIFTYTRDSGATRVNAQGLIVGVDFSTTSVTFGTGAKTFTIAADANVNRDWPIGSRVRATSQAAPLGLMNGTVTSYNPVTQELVIEVTTSTGTGSGTNWRIGSLEFRRDFDPVTLAAKGGLTEATGATNIITNSEGAVGTYTSLATTTASSSFLDFANAIQFGDNSTQRRAYKSTVTTIGQVYTISAYVLMDDNSAPAVGDGGANDFQLFLGGGSQVGGASLTAFPDNAYRVSTTWIATVSSSPNNGAIKNTANSAKGFRITGMQVELGASASSYIPTTTAAVSRAADLLAVDDSNFTQAYNQSQGTLLLECIPTASVNSGAIASINDGTLNNEIRAGIKQSGTRSSIRAIASDGVTDILGLSATGNNILRSNGVDYNEADTGQVANGFAVASAGVGQFIVGGTNGFYSITDDGGATWDNFQLDVADRTQIFGAAFGNGTYVLVGGGVIVTVDPVTGSYTRRVSGTTASIRCVEFLNGTFYAGLSAVGGQPVMLRSTDGITWVAAGTLTGNNANSVTFGAGLVLSTSQDNSLAVGANGVDIVFSGPLLSPYVPILGLNRQWLGSDFANGTFVVVGSQGAIITSTTGLAGSWTLRTSGTANTLRAVRYSTRDGQWYAAGDNGTILRSADAITWENISNDAVGAVIAGGVVQSNPFLDNLIPNEVNTIALRLKANDFALRVNDGAIVTDESGTMPLVDRLNFNFNGHIRKLQYFPSAEEL